MAALIPKVIKIPVLCASWVINIIKVINFGVFMVVIKSEQMMALMAEMPKMNFILRLLTIFFAIITPKTANIPCDI